jgi:Tol biopolymer transport system component
MPYRKLTFLILLVFFSVLSIPVTAQFYSAGQSPGSLRWSQINTDNFQVIFPREYEEQGRYIADILEHAYEHVSVSLDHRPRKVSVIVHNHTVISNGFVSWAPRRIELFTNPPADNETHDWMEYLAVHEFRHVVQVDKLNHGISRLMGILFGEQATGAVLGLFVPLWFLEGDAVVTETAFTYAGRGRVPSFEQGLRAQVLSRGTWSYDKAMFGSCKHHVPNHYELGYQLVAAARVEHGSQVWSGVIDNVARRPWDIFPFSRGMKRNFGSTQDEHYRNTFRFLDSVWTNQMEQQSYTGGLVISPENRLYTSYNQPYWVDDSTVIALKTGLRDIPRIVILGLDGTEQELFAPGWYFPHAFHYAARRVVWNEQRPDPRWEHRNWSEIMTYNIALGIRKRVTDKGRYFAPVLSPEGLRIAAIETTSQDRYYLVVLDSDTGEELFRHSTLNNDFLQIPAWHPDGVHLAVIALDDRGKRIELVNTQTGKSANVMLPTYHDFSAPRFWGDDLLITGSWSGIDNIYKVDTRTQEVIKLVSSEFGAVNASASPSGTDLIYADYSADGYRLKVVPADKLNNIPLREVKDHSPAFHKVLREQENTIVTSSVIPHNDHEMKPYSKIKNLFHLHSWAPAYVDANNQEVNPGVSLLFQNKLSTSFATLGYLWDVNDKTGKFKAAYTYRGWYPVIDFSGETGERRFYYPTEQGTRNFILNENTYRVNVSIPLQFRHHEYFYGISPSISFELNHATPEKSVPDTIFIQRNRFFLAREEQVYRQVYRIFAYNQVRSVARDVFPRWGQILDISYRHTPFSPKVLPTIFAVRGIGYFPGLVRHHGIRLSASYQKRSSIESGADRSFFYGSGNAILYPRGYTGQFHQTVRAIAADYAFPLWYPDLSIPYLIYLMRLRGHVFADYAQAIPFPGSQNQSNPQAQTLTSSGFGLIGDMHLFRFLAPITLGFEMAFPHGQDPDVRLIFGVRF